MLSRLQRHFTEHMAPEADVDPGHARDLAAAALLIEIARVDAAVDEDEFRVIRQLLISTLALAPEEVDDLVHMANEEAEEATSLHQFTHLINQHYGLDEKRQLMVLLWRVAWSDGRLDHYEEQLLRRVADLLHLRHSEFIQARHEVTGES